MKFALRNEIQYGENFKEKSSQPLILLIARNVKSCNYKISKHLFKTLK